MAKRLAPCVTFPEPLQAQRSSSKASPTSRTSAPATTARARFAPRRCPGVTTPPPKERHPHLGGADRSCCLAQPSTRARLTCGLSVPSWRSFFLVTCPFRVKTQHSRNVGSRRCAAVAVEGVSGVARGTHPGVRGGVLARVAAGRGGCPARSWPQRSLCSCWQHLVEIMKLLGTPTERELRAMRATCTSSDLPKLKPYPWERVFPSGTSARAIDLAHKLLCYDPSQRLTATQAPEGLRGALSCCRRALVSPIHPPPAGDGPSILRGCAIHDGWRRARFGARLRAKPVATAPTKFV